MREAANSSACKPSPASKDNKISLAAIVLRIAARRESLKTDYAEVAAAAKKVLSAAVLRSGSFRGDWERIRSWLSPISATNSLNRIN